MAKCPKCGSDRFEYTLRSGGMNVKSTYYRRINRHASSWVIPAGEKKINIQQNNASIGFCPDCGFTQEYKPPVSKGRRILITIVLLIFAISMIIGIIEQITGTNILR